jgi:hypothetical protein
MTFRISSSPSRLRCQQVSCDVHLRDQELNHIWEQGGLVAAQWLYSISVNDKNAMCDLVLDVIKAATREARVVVTCGLLYGTS